MNWIVMVLPAGAFITLGLLVGGFNVIDKKIRERKTRQQAGKK
jgi:Na+-translocating ferredoxin:NAD+ oxidoreductase RnfE subunit